MCWKSSINILNQLIMMRLCSFNAHRASNPIKLQAISSFLNKYFPDVVLIQEIHVVLALKHFSSLYQVFINIEDTARDNIGIAVFVKRNIKVLDKIISKNGRIIGIKVGSALVFTPNVNVFTPNFETTKITFSHQNL